MAEENNPEKGELSGNVENKIDFTATNQHHNNDRPSEDISNEHTLNPRPTVSTTSLNSSHQNTVSSVSSNSFTNSRSKKGSGMKTIQRNRRGVSSRHHGALSDNNSNNSSYNGNNTPGSRLRAASSGTNNSLSNNNRGDTLIHSNGSSDFSNNNSNNRSSSAGDAFLPTSFHSSLRNSSLNKHTGSNSYAATMNNRFKVHMRQNIRLPSNGDDAIELNHSNNNNNLIHRINRMQQVSKNDENEDEEMLRVSNAHGGDSIGSEERRPLIISAQLKHLLPKAYIQNNANRSDNINMNGNQHATQSKFEKIIHWVGDFFSLTSKSKSKFDNPLHGGRHFSDNESINSNSTIMVNMKNKFVCGLVIMFFLITLLVINFTSDQEYLLIAAREKIKQEDNYVDGKIRVKSNLTKGNKTPSLHSLEDDFFGQEDIMVKAFHQKEMEEKDDSLTKENTIVVPSVKLPSSLDDKGSALKMNADNSITTNEEVVVKQPLSTNIEVDTETDDSINNAIKVRYYLPVSNCYPNKKHMLSPNEPLNDAQFHDAAAILKQSIHENSIRNPKSGSKYDYQMMALIHPDVVKCKMTTGLDSFVIEGENRIEILKSLGYTVHVVKEPVDISEISQKITSDFYLYMMINQKDIRNFHVLHAFMSNFPVAVLVELTTIVMQPPDILLDLIVRGSSSNGGAKSTISLDDPLLNAVTKTVFPNGQMKQMTALPPNNQMIDAVYSKDYSGIAPKQWEAGISTSFFVFRPSFDTYHILVDMLTSGHYTNDFGWGGLGYGPFSGSRTYRGLLTYIVQETLFDTSVEVHRCTFSNRASIPTLTIDHGEPMCRDIAEENDSCTDCRDTPLESIVIANVGSCIPPWSCLYQKPMNTKHATKEFIKTKEMCQSFYSTWYKLRQTFEFKHSNNKFSTESPHGNYFVDKFQGYCDKEGKYLPMRLKVEDNNNNNQEEVVGKNETNNNTMEESQKVQN